MSQLSLYSLNSKIDANIYVHPPNHPASMITEDTTHRFVTDTEKSNWNAKASTAIVTTAANGLMSKDDKVKLDGIETGAEVNLTASEILALIKTVDGSTSGLDADTLDNLHASAFATAAHTHLKTDITNFAHVHIKADITDFTHQHLKSEITDFAHTHVRADITNFAHTHVKTDISDFAHTHVKANITDFTHTHGKADITDFSHSHVKTDITDFAHTHNKADITDFGHTHAGTEITSTVSSATNSDMVDNCHAGTAAGNVLKLDSSGFVPIGNIPNSITVLPTNLTTVSRKAGQNYIKSGLKFISKSGGGYQVDTGVADIGGIEYTLSTKADLVLTTNTAYLVTAKTNTADQSLTIGTIKATYPTADINTVVRYDFTQLPPADSSGNDYDLTPNRVMTGSDYTAGWGGNQYSICGDGASFYLSTTNTSWFSINGSSPRHVSVVYTVGANTKQAIFGYGTVESGSSKAFVLAIQPNGLVFPTYTTSHTVTHTVSGSETITVTYPSDIIIPYNFVVGETYYIAMNYNGSDVLDFYVNGAYIGTIYGTLNTSDSPLYLLKSISNTEPLYSTGKIHYFEIKSTTVTPSNIANLSNKMLFPCPYVTSGSGVRNISTMTKSIMNDTTMVPNDTVVVGFIKQTGATTGVTNDTDYKYGRNEGPSKFDGNKDVMTPWQNITKGSTIYIQNPLGTPFIRPTILFKKFLNDSGVLSLVPTFIAADGSSPGISIKRIDSNYIELVAGTNAIADSNSLYSPTGITEPSGYVSLALQLL